MHASDALSPRALEQPQGPESDALQARASDGQPAQRSDAWVHRSAVDAAPVSDAERVQSSAAVDVAYWSVAARSSV